ncbi:4868_t:CDS:2, partial [Gigaspora rosea]
NKITHRIIQKPNLKCLVQFWHYISKDLKEYPFIIILSKGIHNYPAPLPVKTSKSILNDLKDIIYNEDMLDLTVHKLLNQVPLSQLHPSLNNLSKLDALIASRKRAEHPYGQNIYGLLDNGQYHVLCGYKQQIKGLRKSKYIEIDMSFKQVHGSINEWEICAYSETHQKTLTFAQNQGIGCILADEYCGQALANFDSHQWSTAITYEKTNVQDSYRNKSSLQRTINSAKRKQKQSTKQSIEPITTKPKKKARYNKESSSNESSITYEQEQLLNIDYKKLSVQKNLNDELEREIRLCQQLKSLFNSETNNK